MAASAYNMMSAAAVACLPSASCSLVQGAARAFVQQQNRTEPGRRGLFTLVQIMAKGRLGLSHYVMRRRRRQIMGECRGVCVTTALRPVCAQV